MVKIWTAASQTISSRMKTPRGSKTSCPRLLRLQKPIFGVSATSVAEDEFPDALGGLLEFMMGLDFERPGPG